MLINNPYLNEILSKKISIYFSEELNTEVNIESFELGFFPILELNGFRVIDLNKDTLAAFSRLSVQLDYSDLFHKEIHITQCQLKDAKSVIGFDNDNEINVQFLTDYFIPDNPSKRKTSWNINISDVFLTLDGADFTYYSINDSLKINTGLEKTSVFMGRSNMDKLLMECVSLDVDKAFFKMNYHQDTYEIAAEKIKGSDAWINPLEFEYIAENISIEASKVYISLVDSVLLDIQGVMMEGSNNKAFYGDYSANIKVIAEYFNNYENLKVSGPARFTYEDMSCTNLELTTQFSEGVINANIIYGNLNNLSKLVFADESIMKISTRINVEELQTLFNYNQLNYLGKEIKFSSFFKGNKEELGISNFRFENDNNIVLTTNGIANNLHKLDSLKFNFIVNTEFSTLAIDSLFNIKIEEQKIKSKLRIGGNIKEFFLSSIVILDTGKILLNAQYNYPILDAKVLAKNAVLNSYFFDSLFIGKIDFVSEFKNYSFSSDSYSDMEGELSLNSIEVNNIIYKDLTANLQLKDGKGQINLLADDQILQLQASAQIELYENEWSLIGESDITYFNPSLLQDTIVINDISSFISFNIRYGEDDKSYELDLKNTDLTFLETKISYPSIKLFYKESDSLVTGHLFSRPINISLNSNVLLDSLSQYYSIMSQRYLNGDSISDIQNTSYQQIDLTVNINDKDPILEYYTNGIINFDRASLELKSNNIDGINGNLNLPQYKYGEIGARNIKVELNDIQKRLSYNIELEELIWDSIVISNISGIGVVSEKQISADIRNLNKTDSISNRISFNLNQDDEGFWDIRILENWLLIGEEWNISGEGIKTDFSLIKSADLQFEKGVSKLSIKSQDSTFVFKAEQIKLDQQIARYSGLPFTGLVTFELIGKKENIKETIFEAELLVDSLKKGDVYYGQLEARINKPRKDLIITANAELLKDSSKTTIYGEYNFEKELYHTDIILNQFPLTLVEPFTDKVEDLSGLINGQIVSKYSHKKHFLNANLQLKENGFTYRPFQTHFQVKDGSLKVSDNNLILDLSILDKEKNLAQIEGAIGLDNPNPLDLRMETTRFILMDNTMEDSPKFNGKLVVGTRSKITGNIARPDIIAFLSLNEGTNINILNDENELENTGRNSDLVVFKSSLDTINIATEEKEDTVFFLKTTIKSNIEIDEKTKLKIVFDPINSDHLITQGGGSLSYELSENGDESLTGTYFIAEGEYKTTFQELISKKFNISDNSTLIWVGDIDNPNLNLKTYYNFRTSPYPLVASQNTLSTKEQELYSAMQEFRLHMNIKGSLRKPELFFKIESVENSVNNSLTAINNEIERVNNDPSALNQQVFSILLFNKFLATGSETSGVNTDVIVNSLGQLVTGELNKLTSEYINFVDVDLGFSAQNNPDSVGSSYNTSIDLKIERSFYNDRIRIKFGSVWDIQDNDNNPSNKTYKNDFSVEYSITEDGRYKVKVFNKDDRDLDGSDITRNGISVMYSKDFARYKYLFNKPKEIEIED